MTRVASSDRSACASSSDAPIEVGVEPGRARALSSTSRRKLSICTIAGVARRPPRTSSGVVVERSTKPVRHRAADAMGTAGSRSVQTVDDGHGAGRVAEAVAGDVEDDGQGRLLKRRCSGARCSGARCSGGAITSSPRGVGFRCGGDGECLLQGRHRHEGHKSHASVAVDVRVSG